MLPLLLALAAGLFFCVHYRWNKVRGFWAARQVESSPPHPLLGSLTFLMKKDVATWMREVYLKYRQLPYVGIWLFWRPALVINDPEIGRRILLKDSDLFRNRFLTGGKSDPIGCYNIFTADDPDWSNIRRRLTSAFTSAKLRSMQGMIVQKTEELVTRFRREAETKTAFSIKDIYADYTTDITGAAAFGVEGDATLTGHSPMRKVTRDFMEYSIFRGIAWTCVFFFPSLVDVFRLPMFPKSSVEYFKYIFSTVVQQRGGYDQERETRDLMDALMKMKRDAKKNDEDIPEVVLMAQSVAFLQGGFDTTASALAFLTYELAHYPDVQEKLYKEVKAAKDKLKGEDFNMSNLTEIVYLECVIKETLRKYPSMGWLDRVSTQEYEVDERLTIPAGTPVYVNAVGMQMDPDYYPEPYSFNPDRFLPENEASLKPFTFMPFGEGPRMCIGIRFGMITLRFAVASLIMNFKFEPLPDTKKPNEIEFEKKAMFLMPGEKMSVKFISRE